MTNNERPLIPLPDPTDWNALINHCDNLDELTDFEREKAKRAFEFLKSEFGDIFLREAYGNGHPFMWQIVNFAPWTRKELVRFADAMKDLKSQSNYSLLLERLKNPKCFSEANSVMQIGHKAFKAGFNIHFYPQIEKDEKTKSPDLKLTDTKSHDDLFCEVTILGESNVETTAQEISRKIWDKVMFTVPFMNACGKVYKPLSHKHADHIVTEIEKIVQKAQKDNTFQELEIEDVISVGIAPTNDKPLLQKWASERGMQIGSFSGPPYNVDQVYRLKRSIIDKQSQLPLDHANIIAIYSNNFFFWAKDIKAAIIELEEPLYDYDHILTTVIIGGYMGGSPEENVISKGQHLYFKKTRNEFIVDEGLILWNQFCNKRLSPVSISKVYKTFRL